jgi:hypothetical protein
LKSDSAEKIVITSPEEIRELNYRVSGNYYLSLLIKGNVLEICFPLCSESSLACFRINNLVSENDFEGEGWIELLSQEKEVKIVIPPYRSGFYIGKRIKKGLNVEAYSKIFWEIQRSVSILNTNWSEIPVYYSSIGKYLPSIAFKEVENGLFVGVGDSPERAILNSIHLSRIGEGNMQSETEKFLSRFDGVKKKLLRDNIFVSLFYSNSICTDQEDSCIMASKSPKYYVSGGFWSRDFIFWTLPIIERYDPERAKELILLLLGKYWKHKGTHALYLDGRILYEGFELDQLSFYFLALERAIFHKILEPEKSIIMASELMDSLIVRKSDRYNLYSTYLNSSDDPVIYPYVTFDNVALWYSIHAYGARLNNTLLEKSYLEYSENIRKDVMKEMVKEGMFCYSSDLNGNYEFYDDPTGSLLLLPYLGFVDKDSDAMRNTLKWINSDRNEFRIGGKFSGLGNRHVKHPWIHGYATEVLSGFADPSIVDGIPMDGGISCETIDENNGKCLTGIHFPGSSAFLVQSLMNKSEKDRIGKT